MTGLELPLLAIGAAVQLGGTVMSAAGTAADGARARQIADRNAEIMRENGRYRAKQVRRKVSYTNSQLQAQVGNRGLTLAGSALDIMIDNSVQGEIDAANAMREANDRADVEIMQGGAAQARAGNQAIGQIIGGVGNFFKGIA